MPGTVLVVEDDALNRKLFTGLLSGAGYTVAAAANAEEAVAAIRAQRPDLILLDIQLPRISGLRLAEDMRAAGLLEGVPVVAVTARASTRDREDILHSGIDGYLAKPVMPDVLLATVERFIAGHRAAPRPDSGEEEDGAE